MSLRWRYAPASGRKEMSAIQLTQRLSLVPRCGTLERAGLSNVGPAALRYREPYWGRHQAAGTDRESYCIHASANIVYFIAVSTRNSRPCAPN
jgi:hypothetical protein